LTLFCRKTHKKDNTEERVVVLVVVAAAAVGGKRERKVHFPIDFEESERARGVAMCSKKN
jgi:hypothetical protein